MLNLFFLFLGCAPSNDVSTFDQLDPAGPCWDVDLNDGLTSVEEIQDMFSCLNRTGDFDAYSPIGNSLHTQDRDGLSLYEDLLVLLQQENQIESDSIMSDEFLDFLVDAPSEIDPAFSVLSEVIYSRPLGEITASDSATGALYHGLDVIRWGAEQKLDNFVNETSPSSTVEFPTLSLMVGLLEDRPAIYAETLEGVSYLLNAVNSPNNNHWSAAQDNSLRHFISALLKERDGSNYLQSIRPTLSFLAEDDRFRGLFGEKMLLAAENGNLIGATASIAYLSSVNVNGDQLHPGESSALASIFRVLDTANKPLTCDFDLFGIPLTSFTVDNLSVEILSFYAVRPPEDLSSTTRLVDILGWGISDFVLDGIVTYGACPLLTEQLMDDLLALERLSDDEAWDIVVMAMNILNAAHHDVDAFNRIPQIVDLIVNLEHHDMTQPTLELVRDKPFESIMPSVSTLVASLFDTVDTSLDSDPLDYESAIRQIGEWAADANNQFDTDIGWLRGISEHESLWESISELSNLLNHHDAVIYDMSGPILSLSGDESMRHLLYELYEAYTWGSSLEPAYKIIEHPMFIQSIKGDESGNGPLSFTSSMITDGVFSDLMHRLRSSVLLLKDMQE